MSQVSPSLAQETRFDRRFLRVLFKKKLDASGVFSLVNCELPV